MTDLTPTTIKTSSVNMGQKTLHISKFKSKLFFKKSINNWQHILLVFRPCVADPKHVNFEGSKTVYNTRLEHPPYAQNLPLHSSLRPLHNVIKHSCPILTHNFQLPSHLFLLPPPH